LKENEELTVELLNQENNVLVTAKVPFLTSNSETQNLEGVFKKDEEVFGKFNVAIQIS